MRKRTEAKSPPYAGRLTRKEKGDWAEMMFMAKATSLGFIVCRPYGERFFDFVTCPKQGPLSRVQVKSAWTIREGMYRFNTCGGGHRRYRRGEVDFIVAYIVPEDAWYVMPRCKAPGGVAAVAPQVRNGRGKWEKFREAWGLLRGSSQ